jgi:acyl-CoA reductase-like NAD-dependent aldehyde dehydrogenase
MAGLHSVRIDDAQGVGPLVYKCIQAARSAQRNWQSSLFAQRLQVVDRFRRLLVAKAPELAGEMELPIQRRAAETLAAEVIPLADACRFLQRESRKLLKPARLDRGGRPAWLRGTDVEVRREPHGVVLILGTWNYPLLLSGVQALQALVAGNAVLLKPGRGATAAAEALAAMLDEAGLPRGLVQVLPEDADAARAAISAGVDHIVLTGSAETGRAVLRQAAGRLTPCTMELSGCDAVFVQTGADLDLAVRALFFGLRFNGGATCIAPRRVFVHESLAADLETRLQESVGRTRVRGVASREAVRARQLVLQAVASGARLVSGTLQATRSSPAEACIPWIVAEAKPEMPLLEADLMAPVLALVSVSDDEAALAANAQCPYALGATVFGPVPGAGQLAERIDAGCVVVNDMIAPTADPRVPFGGRHQSGFGVTRGAEGLLAMTRVKVIVRQKRRRPRHLEPPSRHDLKLLQRYFQASHGKGFALRLWAGVALVATALRRWIENTFKKETSEDER